MCFLCSDSKRLDQTTEQLRMHRLKPIEYSLIRMSFPTPNGAKYSYYHGCIINNIFFEALIHGHRRMTETRCLCKYLPNWRVPFYSGGTTSSKVWWDGEVVRYVAYRLWYSGKGDNHVIWCCFSQSRHVVVMGFWKIQLLRLPRYNILTY